MIKLKLIKVKRFGYITYYPDCQNSSKLTLVMGKRTIPERQLALLEEIGFKITVKEKS